MLALVFAVGLFAILLVLSFLEPDGTGDPMTVTLGWAAITAGDLVLYRVTRVSTTRRLAAMTSAASVAAHYQTRMLLHLAFGEIPALTAFVAFFIGGGLGVYLMALPLSLALMLWGSPRAGDIRHVQEKIDEHGGTVNLAAALMATG